MNKPLTALTLLALMAGLGLGLGWDDSFTKWAALNKETKAEINPLLGQLSNPQREPLPLPVERNDHRAMNEVNPIEDLAESETWRITVFGMLMDESGYKIDSEKCTIQLQIEGESFDHPFVTNEQGSFAIDCLIPSTSRQINMVTVNITSEGLGGSDGNGGRWVIDPPRKASLRNIYLPQSNEVFLGPLTLQYAQFGLSGVALFEEEPIPNQILLVDHFDSVGNFDEQVQAMTDQNGTFSLPSNKIAGSYRFMPYFSPLRGKVFQPSIQWKVPAGTQGLTVRF